MKLVDLTVSVNTKYLEPHRYSNGPIMQICAVWTIGVHVTSWGLGGTTVVISREFVDYASCSYPYSPILTDYAYNENVKNYYNRAS